MTDEMMSLQSLLEKSTDADLLREMIGFTAQRLMALEVEGLRSVHCYLGPIFGLLFLMLRTSDARKHPFSEPDVWQRCSGLIGQRTG